MSFRRARIVADRERERPGLRIAANRNRRGAAPLIIATGGVNRHDGIVEGREFARRLTDAGVPAEAIRVEDQSKNTWQNVELALQHRSL